MRLFVPANDAAPRRLPLDGRDVELEPADPQT
jgi:hypothetical protein